MPRSSPILPIVFAMPISIFPREKFPDGLIFHHFLIGIDIFEAPPRRRRPASPIMPASGHAFCHDATSGRCFSRCHHGFDALLGRHFIRLPPRAPRAPFFHDVALSTRRVARFPRHEFMRFSHYIYLLSLLPSTPAWRETAEYMAGASRRRAAKFLARPPNFSPHAMPTSDAQTRHLIFAAGRRRWRRHSRAPHAAASPMPWHARARR